MTHFTDLEMRRWSESGPGADRERIVAHLAECAACAASYAAAIRVRGLEGQAPSEVSEFAAAGRAIARPRVLPWRWVAPLAAAAAIVIAVIAPRFLRNTEVADETTLRGGAIHALTPSGATDAPVVFTWSRGLQAKRFRLQVGDSSGVIFTVETSTTRLAAPDSVQKSFAARGELWWSVAALDQDGKTLQESERRVFTLK